MMSERFDISLFAFRSTASNKLLGIVNETVTVIRLPDCWACVNNKKYDTKSNFFIDRYNIQYYTLRVNRKKIYEDKVPVSILIPAKLQKAISEKARRSGRSFSAEVRQAIKKELNFVEAA